MNASQLAFEGFTEASHIEMQRLLWVNNLVQAYALAVYANESSLVFRLKTLGDYIVKGMEVRDDIMIPFVVYAFKHKLSAPRALSQICCLHQQLRYLTAAEQNYARHLIVKYYLKQEG
jgi:hypothetical protein